MLHQAARARPLARAASGLPSVLLKR